MKRTLFASVMVGLAALLQFGCGETIDDAPQPIAGPPNPIQRESILFAVLQNGNLISSSTLSPTVPIDNVPITGLQGGESIVSIDFRNANGILYGLSNQGNLYHINTATGVASLLRRSNNGVPLLFGAVPGGGSRQSMDFDNQTDRMRIISDFGQNLRVNPVDGSQNVDIPVSLLNQGGVNLNIVSIAHTFQFDQQNPNQNNAPFTMVAVDSVRDEFLSTALTNPNDGVFQNFSQLAGLLPFVVAPVVPINTGDLTGLDFSQFDQLFGSFTPDGGNSSQLFASTRQGIADFGTIPGNSAAVDIAIQIDRPVTNFVAVDENNEIVRFNSANPTVLTAPAVAITGLSANDVVRGCDFRPATGQFVVACIDSADNTFRSYNVDLGTGAATLITQFNPGVDNAVAGVGVDFNATVNRLRFVDTDARNLRINIDGGAATTDNALAYAPGDVFEGTVPRIAAVAYTNAFEGASATQLFGIDTAQDNLVAHAGSTNPGEFNLLTSLFGLSSDGVNKLDFDDSTGFDIDTFNNQGWATIFNDLFDTIPQNGIGAHNLVRVDLSNGRCDVLEIIGGGRTVKCFTVLPPGV